jgi:diaminopimelate decarboxylase
MYVSDCISVNEKGHLSIGGCDTVELAAQYGTPAYIYDENEIRKNLREFRKSIDENYGGNGLVAYASKAFSCKEMYRICKQEGTGIDVVSGGELYTALSVGFPADKIVFHGNNTGCIHLSQAFSLRYKLEYSFNSAKLQIPFYMRHYGYISRITHIFNSFHYIFLY